jgi:hypothetical protein
MTSMETLLRRDVSHEASVASFRAAVMILVYIRHHPPWHSAADEMAADPTYPLFPIFSIASAALMLVLLTTNLFRQSWNLGVTFLCFWLFWENLTGGINTVIWSDNAEIKLYVYCDIGELPAFTYLPPTD